MISALIREFLIPLLLFLFLRSVLRNILAGFRRPPSRSSSTPPPPPEARPGGVLHKDPVCGTYVSTDSCITQIVDGRTMYFCSPDCRDKYRQR
jgi:YHS domain-containing protein